jgi:hypothetical protein
MRKTQRIDSVDIGKTHYDLHAGVASLELSLWKMAGPAVLVDEMPTGYLSLALKRSVSRLGNNTG